MIFQINNIFYRLYLNLPRQNTQIEMMVTVEKDILRD